MFPVPSAVMILAATISSGAFIDGHFDPGHQLQVTLSLGKNGEIEAVYHNKTTKDISVDAQVIGSYGLSLEIEDESGERFSWGPPPVPLAKPVYTIIPAGKTFSVTYDFQSPPGHYRIRVKAYGTSNALRYTVAKKN